MPSFLPDLKAHSGRALQLPGSSWLGPLFSPSVLPDPLIKQHPDVVADCFAAPEQRRQVRARARGRRPLSCCAPGWHARRAAAARADSTAPPPPPAQGEIVRTMASLRMTSKHITGELHAIVKGLLGKGTREDTLAWLAAAIEGNAERGKMRVRARATACRFWPRL